MPIQIQVKRGSQANMPVLALGEMYFCSDTNKLFFGTPGVGIGKIQIGDITNVNETLLQLLMEMRSIRLALVQLACEGGRANPRDFDPQILAADAEVAVDAL